MSDFEISINGRVLTNWKSAKVSRTLDENAGKFSFTSTESSLADYPVRAGDAVKILIDGQAALTGFCEVVSTSESKGLHNITVSGRDNTCDLIDSSMPDAVKSLVGPISMKVLIEKVIAALGAKIEVVDQVGNAIEKFTEGEPLGAVAGKKCMQYLTNFARKKQVYLITDGDGNLVIFRPSEKPLNGSLISGVNIKSSSVTYNHAQRFNNYSIRTQLDILSPGIDLSAVETFDVQGIAVDDNIRASRFFEIQSEEEMSKSEADNRATEELNIRRARAMVFTIVVANNALRDKGLLWDIGQLTSVNDTSTGLKGVYIIRSVSFQIDRAGGSVTTITMALPESYSVRTPTSGDQRKADQGGNLQTTTPPEIGGSR